ncbi:DNA-binding protein HEXBP [Trifolium repens]|nr:DNA-binding protein HEXBP [Trifolium repens]
MRKNVMEEIKEDPNSDDHSVLRRFAEGLCFGARRGWDTCLSLIEFTYNNRYHSSIWMSPFKALYERRFRTPLCWYESSESVVLGPEIVQQTTKKVKMIPENMKASHDRQKSYHDKRMKDLGFQERNHAFLSHSSD